MKSGLLIGIGVVLILIAVVSNNRLSRLEEASQRVNDSVSRLGYSLGGNYEYRETTKEDRTTVFLFGGLGGISIIAGIATYSSGKKQPGK